MQLCTKCKTEKDISEFNKTNRNRRYWCRSCEQEYAKQYYMLNREKELSRQKLYYIQNPDKKKDVAQKYWDTHKEELNQKARANNINRRQYNREYRKLKRDTDILIKLKERLRARIGMAFKQIRLGKTVKTQDLVGCDWESLKAHIEKQFIDGMNWEKFGKQIHIDHIIPLSSAITADDLIKLCHYTNLQPLWAIDNIRKSNHIIAGKTNA